MKNLLINWQHKLLIFIFFGLTYAQVLYLGIMQSFNNILLGDGARSLTFIWTVFLISLVNIIYRIILIFTKNDRVTKFLIHLSVEFGKIFVGLSLTACVFIIQVAVVNANKVSLQWQQNKWSVIGVIFFYYINVYYIPNISCNL